MRLVIVYGLATDDYGWLEQFYPARRFSAECENRGIPLRFLFPRDLQSFLASESPDRGETVFLFRGPMPPLIIAETETDGYVCVNSTRARIIADDKLETARWLASHGWPTPETIEPARLAESGLDYPLVAKPRFGSRGRGVTLAESEKDLDALITASNREAENEPTDGARQKNRTVNGTSETMSGGFSRDASEPARGDRDEYILQEYVAASRGRDLRILFAGGEILAAAERRSADGTLVSNACAGGIMSLADSERGATQKAETLALEIAREAGLWYGSVDFLYTDEEETDVTVCELNASPGFEALEKQCGLNIARHIVAALERDFG
jgi:gamma-F420-2:alpha-L-glutamate ligase